MFAGLPGIGVGTLFYVLAALWMPIRECARLVNGTSSVARWRLIGVEFSFAIGIVASIATADRLLAWILGAPAPNVMNPARFLNQEFASLAPASILAAPVIASLILLIGVLLSVEALRVVLAMRRRLVRATAPVREDDVGRAALARKSEAPPRAA